VEGGLYVDGVPVSLGTGGGGGGGSGIGGGGSGGGISGVDIQWRRTPMQYQKIVAPDASENDTFSRQSLAIGPQTLCIGAYNKRFARGKVYIFTRPANAGRTSPWTLSSQPEGQFNGDYFGAAVAVSPDALLVAIGSPGSNSVYLYSRASTSDTFAVISVPDLENVGITQTFGMSLALAIDPDTSDYLLAVGDPLANRVYLYRFNGSALFAAGTLEPNVPISDTLYPQPLYGSQVAFGEGGYWLAISCPGADRVYTYKRSASTWNPASEKLLAYSGAEGSQWGSAISLQSAGATDAQLVI
jgi:hypothetical protein